MIATEEFRTKISLFCVDQAFEVFFDPFHKTFLQLSRSRRIFFRIEILISLFLPLTRKDFNFMRFVNERKYACRDGARNNSAGRSLYPADILCLNSLLAKIISLLFGRAHIKGLAISWARGVTECSTI